MFEILLNGWMVVEGFGNFYFSFKVGNFQEWEFQNGQSWVFVCVVRGVELSYFECVEGDIIQVFV